MDFLCHLAVLSKKMSDLIKKERPFQLFASKKARLGARLSVECFAEIEFAFSLLCLRFYLCSADLYRDMGMSFAVCAHTYESLCSYGESGCGINNPHSTKS